MPARPTRVVFLIRELDHGGAQRQLLTLASHLDPTVFDVVIVTWYAGGRMEAAFRERGVRVITVGKGGRRDMLGFTIRLARTLRRLKPDVVHSFMTGANEMALLLKPVHRAAVIWGVRSTVTVGNAADRLGSLWFRLGAHASHFANLIVFNSRSGMEHHLASGYAAARAVVIPNGVDTDLFRPVPENRERSRMELGVPVSAPLIGIVGRLDPLKDHETFLCAASIFIAQRPGTFFLVVGGGQPAVAARLRERATSLGLGDHVIWLGDRSDAPSLYSALDILALSSVTEGFPNVVVEAMACGTPCVATAVGDIPQIVGDAGAIVPIRAPEAMAVAWGHLLDMTAAERQALAARSRDRIVREFGAKTLASRMASILLAVAGDVDRPRSILTIS